MAKTNPSTCIVQAEKIAEVIEECERLDALQRVLSFVDEDYLSCSDVRLVSELAQAHLSQVILDLKDSLA